MTRPKAKQSERSIVTYAARKLGREWKLTEREAPDFEVVEGARTFGLEVVGLYKKDNGTGVEPKKREGAVQSLLKRYRIRYEKECAAPLWVRFLGDVTDERMERALACLIHIGQDISVPDHVEFSLWEHGDFKVSVTGAEHAEWELVSHRAGWVVTRPEEDLQRVITDKACNLTRYRLSYPDDCRLLIVADRMWDSGMFEIFQPLQLKPMGFDVVYFLAFPDKIAVVAGSEPTVTN